MKKLFALLDRLPRVLVLIYALLFGYLLLVAAADDRSLNYPRVFTALSSLGHLSVLVAVVCFGLQVQQAFLKSLLRQMFPFSMVMFLCGVFLDAMLPTDYSLTVTGLPWLINTATMLLVVAPAYAIHYRYAHPSA